MLARLFIIILIVFWLELGLFLLVVPWTPLWTQNYVLFRWPQLALWLGNYSFRGLVSGVGMIDVGLALYYLYHFPRFRNRLESLLNPPPEEEP